VSLARQYFCYVAKWSGHVLNATCQWDKYIILLQWPFHLFICMITTLSRMLYATSFKPDVLVFASVTKEEKLSHYIKPSVLPVSITRPDAISLTTRRLRLCLYRDESDQLSLNSDPTTLIATSMTQEKHNYSSGHFLDSYDSTKICQNHHDLQPHSFGYIRQVVISRTNGAEMKNITKLQIEGTTYISRIDTICNWK
jgi:hypothetical protein